MGVPTSQKVIGFRNLTLSNWQAQDSFPCLQRKQWY